MTPMPVELLIELRNTFATAFSEEELRDLTLAMGIDYENISGTTKSAKARELASYLWRRSMLPRLAEVGPKLFPDVPWMKILEDHVPVEDPDSDEDPLGDLGEEPDLPPPGKLNHIDLNRVILIFSDYPMFQTPGGRKTVLTLAGVDGIANVDLNGSARDVAAFVAVQLNDYGRTREGDYALGRLMQYVAGDDALPPVQKETLVAIAAKYGITLE